MDVAKKHQKRIAEQTLRMPDAILGIMGGMTKAEARAILNIRRFKIIDKTGCTVAVADGIDDAFYAAGKYDAKHIYDATTDRYVPFHTHSDDSRRFVCLLGSACDVRD